MFKELYVLKDYCEHQMECEKCPIYSICSDYVNGSLFSFMTDLIHKFDELGVKE